MKKLLLLGGSRYLLPVIKAVHDLGYYAITCDYLPSNIAHQYSDEYHNVSIIDKNAILKLACSLKVDGIMSFACDPGVETAAYVAEEIGLPTNPYASVAILQNKVKFRQFLAENDFYVPKAKGYACVDNALHDCDQFHWPIIIKPVDCAGSKGVTKVNEPEGLRIAAEYAMSFSKTRSFIVEEFIEARGFSSDSDCFSVDGKLICASFSDQRFDLEAANRYTPAAYSWPSTMPTKVQTNLREELQRLLTLLNLNTSLYNIETRQGTDGKHYIMEVSPRGGGNRLAEMLRYAAGIDMITNSVRAAVGDRIIGIDGDPVYTNGAWAEVILHSNKSGVFNALYIETEFERRYVIEKDLWVNHGDEIHEFTAANYAIGTLIVRFADHQELALQMEQINEFVKVIIDQ